MINCYNCKINLDWNFCTDDPAEVEKLKDQFVAKLLAGMKDYEDSTAIKIGLFPNRLVQRNRKLLGQYTPDDVFPHIVEKSDALKEFILEGGKKVYVNMHSPRYKVFRRDACKCVVCGLEGTIMLLETDIRKLKPGQTYRAHFNLYGIERGKLLLFTKDHIIPTSKGGSNALENYQTMCAVCNGIKGNESIDFDKIRDLRKKILEEKNHAKV